MTMNDNYINLKRGDRIMVVDEETGEIFKAIIFKIDLSINPFRNPFMKESDKVKIIASKDD